MIPKFYFYLFLISGTSQFECINNISNKYNGHGVACERAARLVCARACWSRVYTLIFPNDYLPHSIAYTSFSLCIVLSILYGFLFLMPSLFKTDFFILVVFRRMGLFVCLAVLRYSPFGFLICLLNGPNSSKWTSLVFFLGTYRFQSSKVDLLSNSAFGLLASVFIYLPYKTIIDRSKMVRLRVIFNM